MVLEFLIPVLQVNIAVQHLSWGRIGGQGQVTFSILVVQRALNYNLLKSKLFLSWFYLPPPFLIPISFSSFALCSVLKPKAWATAVFISITFKLYWVYSSTSWHSLVHSLVFLDMVSLCSSDCPVTPSVDQAGCPRTQFVCISVLGLNATPHLVLM